MQSVIKKYQILTCFICLLLKAFPFFSKRIALLLSWNKTLSWTWYPWASMKYQVQQIAGMKSSAPTISDSVELHRVLSFCLVELTMGNPLPKDRPPPLCPSHVGMDCKCCIHPPLQNASSIGTKDQWQRVRASEIFH